VEIENDKIPNSNPTTNYSLQLFIYVTRIGIIERCGECTERGGHLENKSILDYM
jgi:hypothetical protein